MKILMCGSKLNVKGGMVSVIKNYLSYDKWNEYEIKYIPTHVESNKLCVSIYFLFAYIKILFLVIRKKVDVAYFHTAERGSFYRKAILVRLMHKFGVKTVMHHHAAEFEEFYDGLSEKKKNFVNKTLEMATLNIVLSNRLIPMITDKAPNANVKVLYNAVKVYDKNPYNKNAIEILFLGRLGKRKGTYDFLDAIKRIEDRLPDDIKVNLCGDGDVEEVSVRVKELKLENRIKHIGWIDSTKKAEIFSNTIINVLPSYNEGLPMTILETMAYGIPNISTSIASIPEVIRNGENGFLIQPGEIEKLGNYILDLCNNEQLRNEISQISWREIKDNFALDVHIEQVKKYLSDLK